MPLNETTVPRKLRKDSHRLKQYRASEATPRVAPSFFQMEAQPVTLADSFAVSSELQEDQSLRSGCNSEIPWSSCGCYYEKTTTANTSFCTFDF